ncbi:hypothetical protein LUZ60_005691 [Juncus effusus]|nr:hypothetical protein LUZ60_005691 [Juncus effusus]
MMDSSPPVNWEALDSLILQFAKSEHLVHSDELSNPNLSSPPSSDSSPSESSPSSSSSSYKSRLIIRQIRRCIEAGEIDAALDQLRAHVPVVLDDHRVLFQIQKQKFVELLRRGTEEDRELAIQCLRKSLAPCALDAYPEAYEEFKHVLLALIYNKDDQTSPVTNEWSEKRRYDLAGLISSILRAHLHAYDPIFSMTLRYLISIHKVFCTRQGIPSPISDLTERLLFEERDPPALPQETFFEAPPFDEVDIQALAHAVELTRQGAIDSLKFAKGDLFLAFQNELCRMKFDLPALDKLVHEYCVYRGIIQAFPTNMDASNSAQENETDDLSNTQRENTETRFTNERSNNNSNNEKEEEIEDCSTSEVTRQELGFNNRGLRRCRNYSSNSIMRRRKRWRGRKDEIDSVGTSCENQESQAGTSQDVNQEMGEKYEVMLDMRELAYKGMAQKVVEEINCLDPDFFTQNPTLLFQLKQVEFLKLVSVGDSDGALKVASEYLGPLAAKNEGLVKPLKETLITLLKPNDDAMINKAVPLPLLATSLQVAMGRRLGIEEPQLMKILRSTLHTHTEWFKLQMCKDKFEHLLKIDHLKDTDSLSLSKRVEDPNGSKMLTDGDLNNGSGSMISSSCESSGKLLEEGGSPRPASSAGDVGGCDENAILKVMEFLALPRADAIQLLMQYNGNAETVIQNIFS